LRKLVVAKTGQHFPASPSIADTRIIANMAGLGVGLGATLVTALYQILAGTKQKELKANSTQLLHQYTPQVQVKHGDHQG
jgi:solute carrier family 35 protein E3